MADAVVEGPRLRTLREVAGLSQAELADAATLSQAHISRMENSKRTNVKLSTVNKLAKALGVSFFELITDVRLRSDDATMTHKDIHEAVDRALGNQSTLSEQAIDRIVTEIMRQEIKRASERPRD